MKVLHLSTYDTRGGAARAAFRLHRALLKSAVDSSMLVRTKFSDDATIFGTVSSVGRFAQKFPLFLDDLPVRLCGKRPEEVIFSSAIAPDRVASRSARFSPDVINLHWINAGFMRIETLQRLPRPVVWTLHDMWPFTGGCHYSEGCTRYTDSCGNCPKLESSRGDDLSRSIWRRKAKTWRDTPLTLVAPSRWLAACARSSSLFSDKPIFVIPNGIDTNLFSPRNRTAARKSLGLPQNRHLILFGAIKAVEDKRKGFHHLLSALRIIAGTNVGKESDLLIYGSDEPRDAPDFGMKARYMGHIRDDEEMVMLNSAVDVLVAPSVQDNLPNTVMESLACGTPVVAFNIGGMPDMIVHGETGWLAIPFDSQDLARGIIHVIENVERRNEMGHRARNKVEREYAEDIIARRYTQLYQEILSVNKA